MFKQILVAVDGSPTGNRGLKAAIELASSQAASLTVIHVVDDMQSVSYIGDMGYVPADYVDKLLDDLRANGRKVLTKAEAVARAAKVRREGAARREQGRDRSPTRSSHRRASFAPTRSSSARTAAAGCAAR